MKPTVTIFLLAGFFAGGVFVLSEIDTRISDILYYSQDSMVQSAQASAAATNSLKESIVEFATKNKEDEIYSVLVGGDLMLSRGVGQRIRDLWEDDYTKPFVYVQSLIQDADISFGNLESSMSDRGADTGKKYSFRVPSKTADALAKVGFDVLSTANNHTYDWGPDALCDTTRHIREANMQGVGTGCTEQEANAPARVVLPDGTRVSFLAFTEFYSSVPAKGEKPGFAKFSMQSMTDAIKSEKSEGVDVVMVSIHWGIEYKHRSHVSQQELGVALVEAGADVIIGHHPHVPQEIERYDDGWIIYSLGNFVFDQSWSEPTMKGMLAEIVIQGGKVSNIYPIHTQMNKNFQPKPITPHTLKNAKAEAL